MAEKGVIVQDSATGESVACRDAVELDDDSNSRIIQIVDKASRKNNMDFSSPLRSDVDTSDSYSIGTLPSDIANNLITIGDASAIVVSVIYEDMGSDEGVYITPIVVEADSLVVLGLLEPKRFGGLNDEYEDDYAQVFNIGVETSLDRVLTVMQAWPVFGAYRIGFHIRVGSGVQKVKLFASTCSDWSEGFTAMHSSAFGGPFAFGS